MTRAGLLAVLGEAQRAGFVGGGDLEEHLDHGLGFAEAAGFGATGFTGCFADLGSGGGLPGLVLLAAWPDAEGVLVEAAERRARFLRSALAGLGAGDRVRVAQSRAEEVGRDPEARERFDLVVARSFGPPAVTAECAAALLRVGGVLVVSEPPEDRPERWDESGLATLGFAEARRVVLSAGAYVVIVKTRQTESRFPRRVGIPAKRPLW